MILRELINLIGFKVNESDIKRIDTVMEEVGAKMERAAERASLFFSAPLLGLAVYAVKAASDLTEVQNKFNQVFGDLADKANEYADNLAAPLGRGKKEIRDSMSAFNAMFIGMGAGKEEALGVSEAMQSLLYDFGSFNNLTDQESFERFLAGLSGEGEALRKFGINIMDSALNVELLAEGIQGGTQKATELQKAIARVEIIKKTMGKQGAIGDALRTIGEFAGQMRIAANAIISLASKVGAVLMPATKTIVSGFVKVMDFLEKATPASTRFAAAVLLLSAAIPPLILSIFALSRAGEALAFGWAKLPLLLSAVGRAVMIAQLKMALLPLAILAGLAVLYIIFDDIANWVDGQDSVVGRILGPWKNFAKDFKAIWGPVWFLLLDLWENAKTIFVGWFHYMHGLFTGNAQEMSEGITKMMRGAVDAFVNIIAILIAIVPPLMWVLLKTLGKLFLIGISAALLTLANVLSSIVAGVANFFIPIIKKLWNGTFNIAKGIFTGLWGMLTAFVGNVVNFVSSKVKGIFGFGKKILEKLGIDFGGIQIDGTTGAAPSGPQPEQLTNAYNFFGSPLDTRAQMNGQVIPLTPRPVTRTENNVNVDSKISIQVPEGTPQYQIDMIDKTAKNAVQSQFDQELRGAFSRFEGSE